MDRVQKGSNSCHALMRRELGLSGRRLPQALFTQRVLSNLATNRSSETLYQGGHTTNIYSLRFQYPFVVTYSYSDNTIQLWSVEGAHNCRWAFNFANSTMSYLDEMKVFKNKVVLLGPNRGGKGDKVIKVISLRTGKQVFEYKQSVDQNLIPLDSWAIGDQQEIFGMNQKRIQRMNLDDGQLVEEIKIDAHKYYKAANPALVSVFENFLVIAYKEELEIHDLTKKESYEIKVPYKEMTILARSFDNSRLLWMVQDSLPCLDFVLFDFAKRKATSLYKVACDDPSFEWMCTRRVKMLLHQERIYLGYESGRVVVIDWIAHTQMVVKIRCLIDHISLQEKLLIIGAHTNGDLGTLMFWNPDTLKQIGQTQWPNRRTPPVWSLGKLVVTKDSLLVVRDYSQEVEEVKDHG